jgi:hypothetical protein
MEPPPERLEDWGDALELVVQRLLGSRQVDEGWEGRGHDLEL